MKRYNRLRHIKIDWTYPRKWDEFEDNPSIDECGVYYISRCIFYSDRIDETPVYIGKTRQSFRERFRQHINKNKAFLHKNGEFYVRLGRIIEPHSLATYENEPHGFDRLLLTIESGLITELQSLGYKVERNLTNKQQTKSYCLWYDLVIENTGFHGLLPSIFNNRNHLNDDI